MLEPFRPHTPIQKNTFRCPWRTVRPPWEDDVGDVWVIGLLPDCTPFNDTVRPPEPCLTALQAWRDKTAERLLIVTWTVIHTQPFGRGRSLTVRPPENLPHLPSTTDARSRASKGR